jgi:hypothetical protein
MAIATARPSRCSLLFSPPSQTRAPVTPTSRVVTPNNAHVASATDTPGVMNTANGSIWEVYRSGRKRSGLLAVSVMPRWGANDASVGPLRGQ